MKSYVFFSELSPKIGALVVTAVSLPDDSSEPATVDFTSEESLRQTCVHEALVGPLTNLVAAGYSHEFFKDQDGRLLLLVDATVAALFIRSLAIRSDAAVKYSLSPVPGGFSFCIEE